MTIVIREANKAWHGVRLNQPDWSDHSHSVALTAEIRREKLLFEMILNAHWEPLDFELPQADKDGASPWRRWIDNARETPDDIVPLGRGPEISRTHLSGRSPLGRCPFCTREVLMAAEILHEAPA
jgi:isoamylase